MLGRIVEMTSDSSDPVVRARLYWSQSRLAAAQEDHHRAARYARHALDLLELTEHTYYTAQAHQLLAHIELDRHEPRDALDLLEKGLGLLSDSGTPVDVALFKLEEARALIQLERPEEAASLAMEADRAAGATRARTTLGEASPSSRTSTPSSATRPRRSSSTSWPRSAWRHIRAGT